MANVQPTTGSGDFSQLVLNLFKTGWNPDAIASSYGIPIAAVLSIAQNAGYNVATDPKTGKHVILTGTGPGVPTTSNPPSSTSYQQSTASGLPAGTAPKPPTGNNTSLKNPNAANTANNTNWAALLASQNGANASAAADLAERKREFNVTTSRDIAKQNASEIDALQQRLASMSGPKDAYADYFFSHGLQPPQGYKPAPVPLTDAQTGAYKKMGVTPQQLQGMLTGDGKAGANFGALGSLGSSLQTPPGMPQPLQGQAPTGPQAPVNATGQGGALQGKTPPGGTPIPTTPGGVPSMAVGGQVPGPTGTPKLAVVHGGEEVTPAPADNGSPNVSAQQPPQMPGNAGAGGGAMMNQPGLHPAIAALVDAVSNLLSSPDFKPFVQATQQTTQATPGGVQSMALGGTVSPVAGTGGAPLGALSSAPTSGPTAGAQGVAPNTGYPPYQDNPILPLANMDPYTRALYDVHGRLHPYSAQQEQQMGPQGLAAVQSYVGTVQGGDFDAYQDLANRLKPQSGAPQMGDIQGEGFLTG